VLVFVNDAVDQTHGHFPFPNVGTTYTSNAPFMAPLLPAINAGVERVAADRSAQNLVQQNGQTSGQIGIPTLTLHTRYDPEVPIATETIYRQRVLAAGRGDLLVQRTTADSATASSHRRSWRAASPISWRGWNRV
jgi:hypothetical protein